MTKKCVVKYNLILNANKFHRDMDYPKKEILSKNEQDLLCCRDLKDIFDNLSTEDGEIGLTYSYCSSDYFIHPFIMCPFCGAKIEYYLNKKQRYVNRPEPKWVLVDE